MRRVVITGMGIVSSLGNNKSEVLDSLRHGRSGITFQPEYAELGLRSHVAGAIKNLDIEALIDRKLLRFMAKGHAYAWLAMQEAIADSKLSEALVSNVRTGLIVGAGGTSTESMLEATDTLAEKVFVVWGRIWSPKQCPVVSQPAWLPGQKSKASTTALVLPVQPVRIVSGLGSNRFSSASKTLFLPVVQRKNIGPCHFCSMRWGLYQVNTTILPKKLHVLMMQIVMAS